MSIPRSKSVIEATETYARTQLTDTVTGHGWDHVDRVRQLARSIALSEGADLDIVDLAVLMHDVDDVKFSGDLQGPANAAESWFASLGVDLDLTAKIIEALTAASFTLGRPDESLSVEARCVRDADRLDAIGAVGIARAFAFGGSIGQSMLIQEDGSSTIDHFFSKLLSLNAGMSTRAGRRIARARHQFVVDFLERLSTELGQESLLQKQLHDSMATMRPGD